MPNQKGGLCWGKLFLFILIFGLFSTQAVAASFDCKKATTWLEKTVCANPELSKLDEQLAKAYHDALASLCPEGQKETKEYQRQWVKDLSSYSGAKLRLVFDDSARAAEHALKNAYKDRIKQLQQGLAKFPDRIFKDVHIDDSKTDKTCGNNVDVPIKLTYPQIENPRDENEKFWNDLISQKAIDKYKDYKSKECTDIYSVYTVSFGNKHLISCDNQDYLFEHGALHGFMLGNSLNWLLEDRRELELVDLFNNKTDWRNTLVGLIAKKKKEHEAATNGRFIAPGEDLKTGLINIDKILSDDWTVSKAGLVLRFNAYNFIHYDLITIDWKTLDPYLSKNGRSLIYD